MYAREGVGHAWLVDPALETLEVYRRQDEAWLLVLIAGGDDVVRAEPFDAIEILLTPLWIRPASGVWPPGFEPERRPPCRG